jgi:hypothetical protein
VVKGGDHVVLAAAKKVRSLRQCVARVQIGIQPVGQLRGYGSDGAFRVAALLPEALVKVFQLMTAHREVDGGVLVGIDMHRVLVDVLLSGKRIVSFHSNDLEN